MELDEFEDWRLRLREAFAARPDIQLQAFSVDRLGKNRDYVNRLVNLGTANPSPSLLLKICAELDLSPGWVLDGDNTSQERDEVVRRVLDADAATIRRIKRALDLFEDE